MRKILISILVILLLILAYFTIFHGISIGSFKILGVSQIAQGTSELRELVNEVNSKVTEELQSKKEEVVVSVETLLANKERYFKTVNSSTESALTKASTEKVYKAEYLNIKVGGYARENGIKMIMEIMSEEGSSSDVKTLSFTVTGKYNGIVNFIMSLENDDELEFTIEEFKMIPDEKNLQATFNVYGIRVDLDEESSSQVQDDEEANEENTDTEEIVDEDNDEQTDEEETDTKENTVEDDIIQDFMNEAN